MSVPDCPASAECSLPEEESDPPQPLLSSESLEWDAIANLDDFFRRIYRCPCLLGHVKNRCLVEDRATLGAAVTVISTVVDSSITLLLCRYYEEKGFETILVSRVLNLLALGFTIAFSAFLLLFVRWHALHSECIVKDTCDISQVSTFPLIPTLQFFMELPATCTQLYNFPWLMSTCGAG